MRPRDAAAFGMDGDQALVVLPHDIASEQYVLGALLVKGDAIAEVGDWLKPEDFYRRDHGLVFACIRDMVSGGKEVDPWTVDAYMRGSGVDAAHCSLDYLFDLFNTQTSWRNVAAYAEPVLEASRKRQAIDVAHAIISNAMAPGSASRETVAEAMHALSQLSTERGVGPVSLKTAIKSWATGFDERAKSKERFSGRLTPYRGLNNLTLGLKPADLIIVGGRPAMGKTVLGNGIAMFDSMRGGNPLVFSLEMSKEQFIEREIAAIGEVPHEWLRRAGAPEPDENGNVPEYPTAAEVEDGERYMMRVRNAIMDMRDKDLQIDDQAGITVDQIIHRAKQSHMRKPLTMVLVDHIHIVRTEGAKNEREDIKMSRISGGLKRLAKDLGVPVVALAQLNRSNASRPDKRPTMTDLRECGAIEQDADYILLLHREDYYNPDSYAKGLVEVIVGKSRHSRAGTIPLLNRMDEMRLEDWRGPLPQPPAQDAASSQRRIQGAGLFRNRRDTRSAQSGDAS